MMVGIDRVVQRVQTSHGRIGECRDSANESLAGLLIGADFANDRLFRYVVSFRISVRITRVR